MTLGKFYKDYKLLIWIAFIIFLVINPLRIGFLMSTFGFGEAGTFDIVTGRYDRNWIEGDDLRIDYTEIDKWLAGGHGQTASFAKSGEIIIVDDKIYGSPIEGGPDRSVGNANLFSRQWFANKGFAYPSENAETYLSAGTHYVEYMVGRRVDYGGTWYEMGWAGAATITVKGKPVIKPVCDTGTYVEESNTCEYPISDFTLVCPEGSEEVNGECFSYAEDTVIEGDIIHECYEGEWVKEKQKCVITVETVEYEEEVITESKTSVKSTAMTGFSVGEVPYYVWALVLVFIVLLYMRFVRR